MTPHDPISRTEWRWVMVVGLLVVTASSIPYLVAWSRQSPERVFSGCIILAEDCYSYLAKMRQGADGAWLFRIPYTPENHPGTLLYPFYLLLGKAAALLPAGGLTSRIVLVYHVARVTFGMGLLLAVYRFLASLTSRVTVRRLAWLMVALGGGLGWLLAGLGQMRWYDSPPLDTFCAEGFAFMALLGFPHVAAAQSLLLIGFLCLLRAWDTGRLKALSRAPDAGPEPRRTSIQSDGWRHRLAWTASRGHRSSHTVAIRAGLMWLTMGLIIPFYVLVAWALASTSLVVQSLRRRSGPAHLWRQALSVGLAIVISAPVGLYAYWIFTREPVYASWAAQNRILSPHPLHYLAAYGAPLALAAFAVRDIWYDRSRACLALGWVGIVPLLVYLPVNVQMRLLTGVQVPLSLLAARGAGRLWERGRCWLTLSLLALMIPTTLLLLVSSSAWMTRQPSPSFRDSAEVAALDWLAVRSRPGDVILTGYDTGAYLPARVHARVLAGHDLEAVHAEKKKQQIARFFAATTEDRWRQHFLARYSIDYLFWGPAERELGAFDPRAVDYLDQTYQVEEYAVFTVER